ncbi:premnaspirodiene oxygenase-like [Olea europaea subsp. europaea]|uniref:Premnaspirodiene oxygenase-like n=1 Tax=Olea europaea subsp. europaea TaxID=158383 RepID=A0A8S0TPA6_OLEEU|nr:premnaspirodiene oxygenase-like [Olea europaea subsp. europaea]
MEIPSSFSLTAFSFIISFLFLLFNNSKRFIIPSKFPPGPWKIPLIGNLHQLIGSLPHHSLNKLAQKYGPIMHLQIGELSTVVISSPQIAQEVLQTNGLAFSDRPDLMVNKIIFYNFSAVGGSHYGESWRQMRKLCILELLSPKKVQSYYSIMDEEISRLILSIQSSLGQPINLTEMVLSAQSSIVCRAAVGRRCKDQEKLILLIRESASYAGVFNFADIFPSMKLIHFLFGLDKKLIKMHKKIDHILEGIIQEHEADRIRTRVDEPLEEDLLDVFLRLKESNDFQISINRDNIKANIFEMFIAGIETSTTLVEWAMSELMKNPKTMEKAQAEVRQAFKGKTKIQENDIQTLKYLKMVVKETLRLHPPGPLLKPRKCREQCQIGSYQIPINTFVITNCWAIGRDPNYWENPESFEPERFIKSSINFTGNHFELIPFGAGRRMCPGISFGIASVELALARLLYHFDWKIPGGISPQELDMTEVFGAAVGRKTNLFLIPTSYV